MPKHNRTFRLVAEDGNVRNGGKILGFVLLLYVVSSVGALLPVPPEMSQWVMVASVLSVSWFCLKQEEENITSIGLNINTRFLLEFLSGTVLGILLILLSALIIKCFSSYAHVRNPQVGLGDLFFALIPMLAVSLYEELLFRGYVFQRAIRGMGNAPALLLFALLFILAHWNNPGMEGSTRIWASLTIGLASVMLGLTWIKTRSLALPIGIHLSWNWTQGNLLGFSVSGTQQQGFWLPVFGDAPLWLTGGNFGLEAAVPTVIVSLFAVIAFVKLVPRGET